MTRSRKNQKVLVILNGKGGVGKTTTAVNLSAIFAESHSVLLVDADPQGSASWWIGRSHGTMGFDAAQECDPSLLGRLKDVQDYHLVIVDTPPALDSQGLAAVIPIADYILLPTPPAPMDLAALINTVKTAVSPSGITHRVLLTKVDSRCIGEAVEAQNTLNELNIPACQAYIRAYKVHERVALEGISIRQQGSKQAREALADYRQVVEEIRRDWRSYD